MRWAEHETTELGKTNLHKILVGSKRKNILVGYIRANVRIILKWNLIKCDEVMCTILK